MAITLNGSTGAATGIQSLPSMNAENKVLQIVNQTQGDITSVDISVANNWYNVPGMSASITTTGTNKVQIDCIFNSSWFDGYHYGVRLIRTTGGVQNNLIGVANGNKGTNNLMHEGFSHFYSMPTNGQYTVEPATCKALDNPGAGTHTYQVQCGSYLTGVIWVNRTRQQDNAEYNGTAISTLRLMEVVA